MMFLILTNNCFEFNDKMYIQNIGTAMGSKFAPPYDNLTLGKMEETFLKNCVLKPLLYKRFQDDVFLLWQHGSNQLNNFVEQLNGVNRKFKYTLLFSKEEVNFLDVTVFLTHRTHLRLKFLENPRTPHNT
jgi:hypothetical protein